MFFLGGGGEMQEKLGTEDEKQNQKLLVFADECCLQT